MILLASGIFAGGQREAPGQKTLVIWAHVSAGLTAWNKVAMPLFEQDNPHIKLDYSEHEFETYTTKLVTAISGGGGPDILDNNAVTKGAFEPRGLIVPLDLNAMGYASVDDLYKDFLPGALEPWRGRQGELMGLPYDTAIWQLVLNTKFFREAGLDPTTDAPKNWEELSVVAERLHEATGKKGYQLPFSAHFGWYHMHFQPILWQHGGNVFDDKQMSALDSPATRKAFQVWDNIRNKYNTGCASDFAGPNPAVEFAAGGSVMCLSGPFIHGTVTAANSPDVVDNYTVAEIPQVDPANKAGVLNSWGWLISRNSKMVKESSAFIRWYADRSVDAYLYGAGAPPRYDVYDNPKVQAQIGYEAFKAGIAYARAREGTPYYDETGEAIKRALDEVMLLRRPLEPTIKELHNTVNKIQRGE